MNIKTYFFHLQRIQQWKREAEKPLFDFLTIWPRSHCRPSRAEPSWTWPDRAEPGRASDYSHCKPSRPELKALQLTFLNCEDVKPSACIFINPLKPELNPICYLLAVLGTHHFLHVSRTRVKSLTLRLLMSYIYIYIYIYTHTAPILDVSRSHTTTQHSR